MMRAEQVKQNKELIKEMYYTNGGVGGVMRNAMNHS